jgi:glyoxylase-like metal-dependent hydrolase (beta-lactamase superfamily II)
MPDTYEDGDLTVTKIGPLGPYDNNAYIIADKSSSQALIVDMPADSRSVLEAVHGLHVTAILLTHTHPDHWADYDLVKSATGAAVLCHPAERIMPADKIDRPLADGGEITVGNITVHAMHTPGHTPGSTCFLAGRFLLSGDVLFPGGPGRTQTPQDLQQSIASITVRLHTLPEDTPVLPGHGANTTIGESKREYAAFTSRRHSPDLCGDVTWAG